MSVNAWNAVNVGLVIKALEFLDTYNFDTLEWDHGIMVVWDGRISYEIQEFNRNSDAYRALTTLADLFEGCEHYIKVESI